MKKSWILLTACAALLSGGLAFPVWGDVSLARRYMAEGRHAGSEGMGYGETAG